jgi:hypothetical protein
MNVSPNSTTVDIEKCKIAVDSIWRIVVGVGAAPAVIAIVFRFLIWDSGLYDLEVKRQGPRALVNTARIYGNYDESNGNHATDAVHNHVDTVEEPIQFSLTDLRRFFIEEQNYKYLMGTSLCWFLLDFAFYGLGMGIFNCSDIHVIFLLISEKAILELWPKYSLVAMHPMPKNYPVGIQMLGIHSELLKLLGLVCCFTNTPQIYYL